jgi:molybdopterin-binding protein
MNTIIATISTIKNLQNLNIVECITQNETLTMMNLDLKESLKEGSRIKLAIKPTNITLAKNLSGELSCENILNAVVTEIDKGKLLCSVTLAYEQHTLEAIITLNAAEKLALKVGESLNLLISASDIYIQEILDD